MIIKTTKQIMDTETHLERLHEEDEHFTLIYHNAGKVWVCFDDLKKELSKIESDIMKVIDKDFLDYDKDTVEGVFILLNNCLCNSQEQNTIRNLNEELGSVSCEHKTTGEDKVPNYRKLDSSSSPVSFFECRCGETTSVNSGEEVCVECGSLVKYNKYISSPVQNPKCYVCNKDIYKGETIFRTEKNGEIHSGCYSEHILKLREKKCTCDCPDCIGICVRCGGRL